MRLRLKPKPTTVTAALLVALSAAALVGGCSAPQTPGSPPPAPSSVPNDGMSGMGGMSMATGDGLADTVNGYTLTLRTPPSTTPPGAATFTITHDGTAVTQFDPEQTKLMHLYLIRSDLSGFQQVHPSMSPDGTWSAPITPVTAGAYRIYVQLVPHADVARGALTLSTL